MKKKSTYIISILLCILLCSCNTQTKQQTMNDSETDNLVSENQETDNPFNVDEIEASGQMVSANYGWWVSNYDTTRREIVYDGSELNLDIMFDNSGMECEVGMLIFIDGIAQKYCLSGEAEYDYIVPVQIQEQKQTSLSIHLEPSFGIDGKEHEMYLACMYEPSYQASESNAGYGYYLNILPGLPWKIMHDVSGQTIELASCVKYEPISEEIKNQYIIEKNDGTVTNRMDSTLISRFLQNNETVESGIVNVNEPLHLQLFGGTIKNYRLSVFVDNKLVEAFDGKSYIDIELKDDTLANIELSLDTAKMGIEDYSSMYVMLCPIDYERFDDTFMIDKTDSMILLK